MGRPRRPWTRDEDAALRLAIDQALSQSRPLIWRNISKAVPGRSNKDCRKRWWNSLAEGIARGPWSEEEDRRLVEAVTLYGTNWSQISRVVTSRSPDQCSGHWSQVLDPNINFSDWTKQEDEQLLQAVGSLGTNWAAISTIHTPKRNTLALKNRYSTLSLRYKNQEKAKQGGKPVKDQSRSTNFVAPTENDTDRPPSSFYKRASDGINQEDEDENENNDDDDDDDDGDDDDDDVGVERDYMGRRQREQVGDECFTPGEVLLRPRQTKQSDGRTTTSIATGSSALDIGIGTPNTSFSLFDRDSTFFVVDSFDRNGAALVFREDGVFESNVNNNGTNCIKASDLGVDRELRDSYLLEEEEKTRTSCKTSNSEFSKTRSHHEERDPHVAENLGPFVIAEEVQVDGHHRGDSDNMMQTATPVDLTPLDAHKDRTGGITDVCSPRQKCRVFVDIICERSQLSTVMIKLADAGERVSMKIDQIT